MSMLEGERWRGKEGKARQEWEEDSRVTENAAPL